MLTSTDDDSVVSGVLSWSYSLLAGSRNLTTTIEYFHSGFGIDDGHYDRASLAANPELLKRLERGELFTLAQNYLAGAATIELTPLWQLTTSLFRNLDDDSMLLQLFSHHDLQQDLQLLRTSYQQLADSDYATIRSVEQLASLVQGGQP